MLTEKLLLLTTTGRRSGTERTIPVFYLRDAHGLRNEITILSESAPEAVVFTRSFRPRSCRASTARSRQPRQSPILAA